MTVERYLDPQEFAERMAISKRTVLSWVARGVLREGIHYVRITPHTLRFPYPQCLEAPLAEARAEAERQARIVREAKAEARTIREPRRKRGPRINLDYCTP